MPGARRISCPGFSLNSDAVRFQRSDPEGQTTPVRLSDIWGRERALSEKLRLGNPGAVSFHMDALNDCDWSDNQYQRQTAFQNEIN